MHAQGKKIRRFSRVYLWKVSYRPLLPGNFFSFLVETESHCVTQAGPKLLGASNAPASAFQSVVL